MPSFGFREIRYKLMKPLLLTNVRGVADGATSLDEPEVQIRVLRAPELIILRKKIVMHGK